MRKKEQRLWDRMRRALNGRVRLERIENVVANGTADVFALAGGVVTPLELKSVDAFPARATTRVLGAEGLSRDQRNWHSDWQRWGGRSFVVISVGSHELFVISGGLCDVVNEMPAHDLAAFAMARDFDALAALLGAKR